MTLTDYSDQTGCPTSRRGQTVVLRSGAPPACRGSATGMILKPSPQDEVSFIAAQTAARDWADKALELGQSGNTEQARGARIRAEACLAKMLALEAQGGRLKNDKPPIALARLKRRSPPAERQAAQLNNAALLTWPRLPVPGS
jgi:hypothetical protein